MIFKKQRQGHALESYCHILFSGWVIPDKTEIVNYADKRVLNTDIVSLSQRMDYILERYGTKPEYRQRLRRIGKYAEKTEKRIFGLIDITPEQIGQMCQSEWGSSFAP